MPSRAAGLVLKSLVVIVTLGYAMPSSATRVVGYAAGLVNDFHIEAEGEGENVFGLGADALLGQAARIDFSYDTDLAPPDTNPAEDRGRFETTESDPAWLEMSISLNDIDYEFSPTVRYADMGTGFGLGEYDFFQLAVLRYVPIENGKRREFIELRLELPPGSVPDGSLPTDVPATAPFGQSVNGVTFSINDFDLDPTTGEPTYVRRLYFNLDITEIAIVPVPEPTTGLLIAFGLVSFGVKAKRGPNGSSLSDAAASTSRAPRDAGRC